LLWALAYRITGVAADADEIVQESYVRALEHPPKGEMRPWLVRIAANLARDRLRARRRDGYKGPFVASPLEDDAPSPEQPPDARYDLKESATLAFLHALEALSAKARAVVVLRDVLDCSVEETAAALGMSEANVKVTHHRARRILSSYERARYRAPPEAIQDALQRFFAAIAMGDATQVAALLSDDALALQDGAGEFLAAGVELHGPARIAQVMIGITKHAAPIVGGSLRMLAGQPSMVVDTAPDRARLAPRFVVTCDLAPDGKIVRVYMILASRKLLSVRA
jgi:RNA polymerase sigma-70 factor (ECF subfamily)